MAQKQFSIITSAIQRARDNPAFVRAFDGMMSDEEKLKMYGLFKISTVGFLHDQPEGSLPDVGFFDIKRKLMRQAWEDASRTVSSVAEAQMIYTEHAARLYAKVGDMVSGK